MNLVKEKQGGLVPPGLKRWPFKLIKHFTDTTCVSPSPAGPAGCCPLNFLSLINLKIRVRASIHGLFGTGGHECTVGLVGSCNFRKCDVSNIFTFENDPSDPDSNKSGKIKKLWSFVKSLKKDAYGITSLRENGILKTDTKEKADICNRQFQSAFTREADSDPPSIGASPFSSMGEITVDPKGVGKLLDGLNVHKAPGPDGLNARVLKLCSTQISPILALIYNESLAQGNVPDDWRHANVSPVFKKGDK